MKLKMMDNQITSIDEATLDPVERVQRRMRLRKVSKEKKGPDVGIKMNTDPVTRANNDPRNTAVGKGSLRGSRHKWINKRKSRRYHAEAAFINKITGKSASEVVIESHDVDLIDLLTLIDYSLKENINVSELSRIKLIILELLDTNGYKSRPVLCKADDIESRDECLNIVISNLANECMARFPYRWIEEIVNEQMNITKYFVVGDMVNNNLLSKAESDSLVKIIKQI